ncbi:MAG: site-specific integrase [Planctomycetota bacterium]|nr:site-specific integrase [Planctomycetota bacterium]MDE2215749.1 site-specific integrase [Planctomycetota bacterium]
MYKRGGVWWTCIRHNGKKIQKSLETVDARLAKSIEAKIRTAIAEGKFFDKPVGENKSFKDMMEKFMQEHAPKVSKRTQESYRTSLGNLMPYFADMRLSSITPKAITGYKALRYSTGVKPATVNLEHALLSKAFNLAVKEWEWLKENPVSKVRKDKENNQRDRWLTVEEAQRLLESSPQWLREIILFDLHTGLRRGELLSLEWDKVNLIRKVVIIQKSKNGKPRTIPLTPTALDILEEKAKIKSLKTNLVFLNGFGENITTGSFEKAFYNALKKTGIKDFRFHDLRHTFATRLAQRGVDIYKISKLLGHQSITMTQRYAHHCPESLRDGIQVLENPDYNLTTVVENRNVLNA